MDVFLMYVKDLTAAFYDHKNRSKKSFLFYDHAVKDLTFGVVNKKVYFFMTTKIPHTPIQENMASEK